LAECALGYPYGLIVHGLQGHASNVSLVESRPMFASMLRSSLIISPLGISDHLGKPRRQVYVNTNDFDKEFEGATAGIRTIQNTGRPKVAVFEYLLHPDTYV
jgi:hypothetical protein